MRDAAIIAGYTLRESLRRRVFLAVLLLTAGFLGIYAIGTAEVYDGVDELALDDGGSVVDETAVIGGTLLGLAMFTTLFLGTVLAVFLTLGAVRGDAERGLLQPLVVRPVGRATLLLGRFGGAAGVCAAYVLAVFAAALAITNAIVGWWPDRLLGPALGLAVAVAIIAGLSLLGSVFLSAAANGIATFMLFGAGLTAGLLGQIGDALGSEDLELVARVASWALPFEALYQSGLSGLTADTSGIAGIVVRLGPFGGAQDFGPLLWPWVAVYLSLLGAAAVAGFRRRDL